jgi:polar amino acid transport system substrate-binding protein
MEQSRMMRRINLRLSKRLFRLILFAVLAMIMLLIVMYPAEATPHAACQRVILTGDPDYPPFSWYENNTFHGSAIEIVSLALNRIQLPYAIRYAGPFNKVLDAAKTGEIDLVAELKNTPKRAQYMAFSKVSIFHNPIAVFTRADRQLALNRWDDLIGLRGGITIGNRFGGGLDEFIANRLTVESADRIGLNFAKLSNGRIDYFISSYYPALSYLIREQRESEFNVLQPFAVVSDNFVGWSKISPCVDKLREFDAALSAMVRSGEVRRILDDNIDHLRHGRMVSHAR